MDPNATLEDIVQAAYNANATELLAKATELAEWFQRGGFAPEPGQWADPNN